MGREEGYWLMEQGGKASCTSGGPLTDFGRGRPNLPLPQERVKTGATST